jgi:CheY-like chemotaxis protein
VLDGLAALDALNADADCADIPVVALTSAASVHDEAILRDRGFHEVVFKPIRPEELVKLAESHVAHATPAAKNAETESPDPPSLTV